TTAATFSLGMIIIQVVSSSLITGVIIWFVVQLSVAPLRPLRLRHALRALKQSLKRLVWTMFRVGIITLLLLALLVIPGAIYFIITPLMATLTALLYLKVRQLGGERFNQILDQFEDDEAPKTRWQQRMRERLNSSSATRSA